MRTRSVTVAAATAALLLLSLPAHAVTPIACAYWADPTSPPTPAQNAGIIHNVFYDNFGGGSLDSTKWSVASGVSYTVSGSGSSGCLIITDGGTGNFGADISSVPKFSATVGGNFRPIYFEVWAAFRKSDATTSVNSPLDAWPAWWLISDKVLSGSLPNHTNFSEIDMNECYPTSTSTCTNIGTLHNWKTDTSCGYNTCIDTSAPATNAAVEPLGYASATQFQEYGILIAPNPNDSSNPTVQWFINGNYSSSVGWPQFGVVVGSGTSWPTVLVDQLILNLGTMRASGSLGAPVTIKQVSVWQ